MLLKTIKVMELLSGIACLQKRGCVRGNTGLRLPATVKRLAEHAAVRFITARSLPNKVDLQRPAGLLTARFLPRCSCPRICSSREVLP